MLPTPPAGKATVAALAAVLLLAALAGAAPAPVPDAAADDLVVHADGVGATSARWDSARWDSARWDSSRWDSSRWDSSRWDSARWDSSRWDSARWDSSRWDSSRWDSARWDGSAFEPDPLLAYQWGLDALRVPDAWTRTSGEMRRTICVLDTGMDASHPDLAPHFAGGWSFLDGTTDVADASGHGTHVAGVAAAAVGNGVGTAGVVNARLLVGKVLNDQGVGGLGTLAQGIRWCADQGAHVISMSLGTAQDSPAVRRAVEHAAAKGALLVASAGNLDGCAGCPVYPAAYPQVLGVSALGRDGLSAALADPAAHVDLAAPGELVAGPFPGDGYALGTGTSQATALVAGAAALAWDADPSLTADEVADLLRASARDLGEPGWDAATGWGIPDVAELVDLALAP